MKANEAPEKLYFGEIDKSVLDIYSTKESDNEVEYTRTDVFIEKTLKFLDENFFFNNLHYSIESGVFDSKEEMFEDFEEYLKK